MWVYGCWRLSPIVGERSSSGSRTPGRLETALKELRHLSRRKLAIARALDATSKQHNRFPGFSAGSPTSAAITSIVLTTRLAKTHGEIVVEGLDAAGMLRQKGLTGARARRRGLSDSALGETRRQLCLQNPLVRIASYPCRPLHTHHRKPAMHAVISMTSDGPNAGPATPPPADAGPSTNATTTPRSTSHATRTPTSHSDSAVGPVRVAVKRGADRKTRLGRAGGREARKGRSHQAAEQPQEGVPD